MEKDQSHFVSSVSFFVVVLPASIRIHTCVQYFWVMIIQVEKTNSHLHFVCSVLVWQSYFPSRGIVLLCRNPVADVNKLYHLHIFCIFLPHNNISFNTDQRTDTIIMQTFALYQILPLAPSSSTLIWRPSLPHQLYLSIVYSFHSVYSTNQRTNHPPWPPMNDDFPTELYSRLHTFRSRRMLFSVHCADRAVPEG